jgi:type I restriction enzyme, S subunit
MVKQLPKEWKWKTVEEVSKSLSSGGTPRRKVKEYWGGDIYWLKISDIKNTYTESSAEKITKKGLEESSAKLFPKGTILYSIFATLGEISILNISAATNQAIVGIIPDNTIVNTKYLYYCLKSQKEMIISKKSHATQDNINLSILKQHKIPIPPLNLQEQIVEILESSEKLMKRRKNNNEETDKLLNSIFYNLFESKEKIKIRELVKKGETRDPRKKSNEEFNYIDISGVDGKSGNIIGCKRIIGKEAPSRARKIIKKNDVIVSTVRPNLNATAQVQEKYDNEICSTGFCVLHIEDKLISDYIYTYTRKKIFINQLVSVARGASYPAVTDKDVLDTIIPKPDKKKLIIFHELFQKIKIIKENQQNSTNKIHFLFNAIMQKAFNGSL